MGKRIYYRIFSRIDFIKGDILKQEELKVWTTSSIRVAHQHKKIKDNDKFVKLIDYQKAKSGFDIQSAWIDNLDREIIRLEKDILSLKECNLNNVELAGKYLQQKDDAISENKKVNQDNDMLNLENSDLRNKLKLLRWKTKCLENNIQDNYNLLSEY